MSTIKNIKKVKKSSGYISNLHLRTEFHQNQTIGLASSDVYWHRHISTHTDRQNIFFQQNNFLNLGGL